MSSEDRSPSPLPPPRTAPPVAPRFPGFPQWRGPMSTSSRVAGRSPHPPLSSQFPPSQFQMMSPPSPMLLSQPTPMVMNSRPQFPSSPPPMPSTPTPSTPCSATQPCPLTPSQQSTSPMSIGLPTQPRRNIQPTSTSATREYGFDLNEQWQQDAEFYDNQKLAGRIHSHERSDPQPLRRNSTSKDVILSNYQWRHCCTSNTTITG